MPKALDEKHKQQRKTRRYEHKQQRKEAARESFWKQIATKEGIHIRF